MNETWKVRLRSWWPTLRPAVLIPLVAVVFLLGMRLGGYFVERDMHNANTVIQPRASVGQRDNNGQLRAFISDVAGNEQMWAYTVSITGLTPYAQFDVQLRSVGHNYYGRNSGPGGQADANGDATYQWINDASFGGYPGQYVLRIIDKASGASYEVYPPGFGK